MSGGVSTTVLERTVRGVASGHLAPAQRRQALAVLQPVWTDSRFMDPYWEARTATPAARYRTRIYFHRIGEQWRVFARLFLVLAGFSVNSRRNHRPVRSPARFLAMFRELIWLTNFMARENVSCMAEFSAHSLTKALREWVASTARADRKTKSHTALFGMVVTLQRLHELGPSHLGLLPDGLVLNPTEFASPAILGVRLEPKRPTPAIPEAIAHRLWQSANTWLEEVAPVVLAALPVASADERLTRGGSKAFSNRRRALLAQAGYRRRVSALVKPLRFSLGSAMRAPAHERTNVEWLLRCPREALETLWNLSLTAAYIVMATLSGFRVSELLSVACGGLVKRASGWSVQSTVFKTSSRTDGTLTERPVPEGFAEAHGVLRSYARAREGDGPTDPLFVTWRGNVPTDFRVNRWVNKFAKLHGIEWRMTTHQFRKFFALFYVRRFRGPIDALRWHFRHVSMAMIEAYIKDAINARYLAEAEAEVAEEILSSIIHGDHAYAFPPPVSRYAGMQERYRALNLPLEEAEAVIRKAEAIPGARVTAMEWGYCLHSAPCTALAACRSVSGLPDRELAGPTECFGCPLLVVGRENTERIRRSLVFHQDVLESPMVAPRAKKLSAELVERINVVLRDFDGEVREASSSVAAVPV